MLIALLLAPSSARAERVSETPDGGADAAADTLPQWIVMAPPDENDPGACHCFWGEDMQAEVPVVLLALPALALGARRFSAKSPHK